MLQNRLDGALQYKWIMEQKHTAKATQEFLKEKKWNVLSVNEVKSEDRKMNKQAANEISS